MQPRMSRKHNICNSKILFIIPSLIIVMLLFVVPIFYSLWLSFHTGELKNLYFFGIGNYKRMINDRTYQITLLNSIEFVLLIVPTIIVISILATISLHSIHSERLKNIISSIFYFPCITSPVVYTLFYKQLAYSDGLLSNTLVNLGIVDSGFNLLQDELLSKIYLSIICIWAWSGFYIIILYSAVEGIDHKIYLSAQLDGANTICIYRRIIILLVRPVLLLIITLCTCSTFQLYVEIALITKGGPGESTYTLSLYLYRKVFTYLADYGYSSAIGISIMLLNALFSLLIIKIRKK